MFEPMEIQTKAYQVIDRSVKAMGNSGGIYLPKDWIGKKVKVLLIDNEEKTNTKSDSDDNIEGAIINAK